MIPNRITFAALCISLFSCAVALGSESDPALQELIRKLRNSERLYERLEVRYGSVMKNSVLNSGESPRRTARQIEKRIHLVTQLPYYFASVTTELTYFDDREERFESQYGFDGQYTKLRSQRIGNIDDRNLVMPVIPPQRFACGQLGFHCLTDIIGHAPTVHADPALQRMARVEASLLGKTTWRDLECVQLELRLFGRGNDKPKERWVLWIAPDRSFNVVRSVNYVLSRNATVPQAERETADWRELAPGVWLPFKATETPRDIAILNEEGKSAPPNFMTFQVESVTLKPDYKIDFFRNITMPANGIIYWLEKGEIVREELVGDEQ